MDIAPRRRLGLLVSTGSYELRLGRSFLLALFVFLSLLFRDGREEGLGEVRELGPFFGRERLHEARRDDDQQLVRGFARGAAAEEIAEDRDIAQAADSIYGLDHTVVDEAGDGEALAVSQDDFGFGA